MQHKEPTPEQERITTLALEIQQHGFDYFDGKLTGQEWLQLVVDAVQTHQAEAAPLTQAQIDNELVNYVVGLRTFPDLVVSLRMSEAEVQTLIGQRVHTLSLPPRVAEKMTREAAGQASEVQA